MEFDIGSITGIAKDGLGLIKSTTEVIKNVRDLASTGKPESKQLIDSAVETARDKLMELTDKHIALQDIAMALLERNTQIIKDKAILEEKLMELEKFEAAREHFERVPLALHTFAYREKANGSSKEPQPLFCPQCFDSGKKSYLNFHEHAMHTMHMKCSACSASVHIARNDGPAVLMGSTKASRDFFDDY